MARCGPFRGAAHTLAGARWSPGGGAGCELPAAAACAQGSGSLGGAVGQTCDHVGHPPSSGFLVHICLAWTGMACFWRCQPSEVELRPSRSRHIGWAAAATAHRFPRRKSCRSLFGGSACTSSQPTPAAAPPSAGWSGRARQQMRSERRLARTKWPLPRRLFCLFARSPPCLPTDPFHP